MWPSVPVADWFLRQAVLTIQEGSYTAPLLVSRERGCETRWASITASRMGALAVEWRYATRYLAELVASTAGCCKHSAVFFVLVELWISGAIR